MKFFLNDRILLPSIKINFIMKTEKRIIQLDYIRCFACLLVILLHVCAYYINFYDEVKKSYWIVANIIESFTRICVPLFFMISGFIFMSNKKPKFKNYIRLLTSLLFYSSISLILFLLARKISPSSIVMEKFSFFNEPSFYHLWFFYPMIGIYIFSNFIYLEKLNTKHIVICIFVIFLLLNPRLNDLSLVMTGINISNLFMIDGEFIYYFLYAITGSVIGREFLYNKIKINSYLLISIIILSSSLTSYFNSISYQFGNEKKFSFYDFNSPLIFICSLSFFILIVSLNFSKKQFKLVSFISDNSLSIYGIHAFIISTIKRIIDYKSYNPIIFIPIIFTLVLFLSLFFSLLIRKVDKKRLFS